MAKRTLAAGRTGYLLVKLGEILRANADEALAAVDLNARKYNLLVMVREDASLSQQDLSGLLGLDPNIVGAVVGELEDAGLVARARDSADRRRHRLQLSAAGTRRLAQAEELVKGVEDEILRPLDRAEIAALAEAAAKALAPHWPLERRR